MDRNDFIKNSIALASGLLIPKSIFADRRRGHPLPLGTGVSTPVTYPTLDPAKKGTNETLSGGNLTATNSSGSACVLTTNTGAYKTVGGGGGKWYCEFTLTTWAGFDAYGLAKNTAGLNIFCGQDAAGWGWLGGYIWNGGSNLRNYGTGSNVAGSVIGLAFDATTGNFWVSDASGTWIGISPIANPSTGANPTNGGSVLSGAWAPCVSHYSTAGTTINYGATAFAHSIPSGFSAWHN